jgi:transcriptional regulator with XRE-family HTH domain
MENKGINFDYRSVLAESVRSLRKGRGMSQTELASACQITQATLSEIENSRGNPTFDVLIRIANALDVPPFSLIGADIALKELSRALPGGGAVFGTLIGNLVDNFANTTFARWLVKILLSTAGENAADTLRASQPIIVAR